MIEELSLRKQCRAEKSSIKLNCQQEQRNLKQKIIGDNTVSATYFDIKIMWRDMRHYQAETALYWHFRFESNRTLSLALRSLWLDSGGGCSFLVCRDLQQSQKRRCHECCDQSHDHHHRKQSGG